MVVPVVAVVIAGIAVAQPSVAGATATPSLSRAAGVAISTPEQVSSGKAQLLGAASTSQRLRLTVGLATPHPAEADAFVASLKDKTSPNFRHFLTAAQWNARFAPSAKSEQAVVDWARSQGLTVTRRYANRLVVDLEGTVGTIDKALGVTINDYRLGATAFYSNDKSASLPSSIAGIVQSVDGLNSLQTLKATNTRTAAMPAYSAGPTRQTGPSAHANGNKALLAKAMAASKKKLAVNKTIGPKLTNGYYDPTDIYSDQAYSVDALNAQGHCCNPTHAANVTPPATSIAISTVGTHNASDFSGFQSQYPYLAYHYQEFYIDGTPTCCDDEGTLDFEWSTAMANSFGSYVDTAMVYLYDGANAQLGTFTDIWNQMLSDGKARTMTSSWGCAESYCYDSGTMNTDHGIFDSMLGQGWTLMSASDDKGAYADCSHVSVEYPASDPDVLSAGGTDLFAAGTFSSETAWVGGTSAGSCANNGGGGGGGCSVQWSLPSYQNGRIANLCTTRAEPDFSLNAGIGQNYYFNGALHGVGGTSIVSPELAGIWAQINAYLGSFPSAACSNGCTTVGQANYDVYSALAGATHDPYYDITSGCTTNDAGPGFCGITGYDRATGLGSADLFQLAMQVLWFNVIELSPPTVSVSGPGGSYVNGGSISWSIVDNGTGSGAPTGVAGYTAQWGSDPGNPTTELHGGSGNYFWDGPAAKNATSGSVSVASGGEGCHTLYVRAWDNIGESAVTPYTTCYDGTAPTITTPTAQFSAGEAASTDGKAPVIFKWTGSDALSGVNHYEPYLSTDGGSYASLGTQTSNKIDLKLASGHTYEFAVRDVDNAGNASAYAFSTNYSLKLFTETDPKITYSSGWTTQTTSTAVGGALKYSTVAGKTATFQYSGGAVAYVGGTGAAYGKATVKLDNSTTSVNTHATSDKPRVLLFTSKVSTGQHTLTITNQGTSGHSRIDLDTLLVLKPA